MSREWALPLVVRIERVDPPTRTDALEAAALAVLRILTDPRGQAAGPWAGQIGSWESSGRIRKVVRRARGAGWDRAAALDGITVEHGSAQLRVFPPVPVDDWPPDLARLQVGGTELADPAEPPEPPPGGPVIWLAPEVSMTAGKAMAQVGHAAQLAWWASPPPGRASWAAADLGTAVRTAALDRWSRLLSADLPAVRDAGFTEVAPGAHTAIAELPWLPAVPRERRGAGAAARWLRRATRRPGT
jgi:peptidyl-tRNA hydrolase